MPECDEIYEWQLKWSRVCEWIEIVRWWTPTIKKTQNLELGLFGEFRVYNKY